MLEGRRILIVEDETLVAMELEGLLAEHGCIVIGPAPTVDRALALLDHDRPDAAILDLNLNGQKATPVAAALVGRGVPFVVATGYGEARSLHPELKDAPRVDKPVNRDELLRALRRILGALPTV